MTPANLPALLQRFFTDRLQSQLDASPHTVASYRDAFRLLLVFAAERLGRPPSRLRVEDLDPAWGGLPIRHGVMGRREAEAPPGACMAIAGVIDSRHEASASRPTVRPRGHLHGP
jgi:hypothetical protein